MDLADKNISSFKKVIDDLSNIDSKENPVFSLQRIWQEEDTSELDRKEKEVLLYLKNKGPTKPTEYKGIFQCHAECHLFPAQFHCIRLCFVRL